MHVTVWLDHVIIKFQLMTPNQLCIWIYVTHIIKFCKDLITHLIKLCVLYEFVFTHDHVFEKMITVLCNLNAVTTGLTSVVAVLLIIIMYIHQLKLIAWLISTSLYFPSNFNMAGYQALLCQVPVMWYCGL